jgi:hypothetical protein
MRAARAPRARRAAPPPRRRRTCCAAAAELGQIELHVGVLLEPVARRAAARRGQREQQKEALAAHDDTGRGSATKEQDAAAAQESRTCARARRRNFAMRTVCARARIRAAVTTRIARYTYAQTTSGLLAALDSLVT